jgi:starvation-inducible DNA-binding protein
MITTTIAQRLQDTLVGVLDLGLTIKQAHWNARGLGFRALHLHLDEIADELRQHVDEFAERVATLGEAPDGRSVTIAGCSPLITLPAGRLSVAQATIEIAERLELTAELARAHVEPLGGEDSISQDLVIELVAALEKHAWLLRSTEDEPRP